MEAALVLRWKKIGWMWIHLWEKIGAQKYQICGQEDTFRFQYGA